MHPYLPHLLADITAAHRIDNAQPTQESQTIEDELEEIERWVAGREHEHTFGYYCGLTTEGFPPPEQFSQKELQQVCRAIDELLFSWNATIDLPKKMPLPIKYKFMVNTLNEPFTPVSSGFIGFDFCTGYAPDCALKEYCPCLKYWNEDL